MTLKSVRITWAFKDLLEQIAEEHIQEVAHKLREGGVAVKVVKGELTYPDRNGQQA